MLPSFFAFYFPPRIPFARVATMFPASCMIFSGWSSLPSERSVVKSPISLPMPPAEAVEVSSAADFAVFLRACASFAAIVDFLALVVALSPVGFFTAAAFLAATGFAVDLALVVFLVDVVLEVVDFEEEAFALVDFAVDLVLDAFVLVEPFFAVEPLFEVEELFVLDDFLVLDCEAFERDVVEREAVLLRVEVEPVDFLRDVEREVLFFTSDAPPSIAAAMRSSNPNESAIIVPSSRCSTYGCASCARSHAEWCSR